LKLAKGPVWLVDATTYRRKLDPELERSKARFFRIETHARSRRLGPSATRGTRTYSAGLLRIATLLARAGHEVRYLHLEEVAVALEETPSAEAPAVIGFGAVCPTVPACASLSLAAKDRFPGVRTALGGAHATVAATLILKRFGDAFDDVVDGYEEEAAGRLMGLPPRRPPLPGCRLDYRLLPHPVREYSINLMTATGCPFRCTYCQDRLLPRITGDLDGGLGELVGDGGLAPGTPIHFSDSVLGGNVPRAMKVCQELAQLDHGMVLSCDMRPEFANAQLLGQLQEAGFREIRMGLDSADADVLLTAGRMAKPRRLSQVLERIRDAAPGLYVSIYLVTGLPGTTGATLDENVAIVHRLLEHGLADQVKHHLYVPYPLDSCPSNDIRVEIVDQDWSAYDRNSFPVYELPGVDREQIWQAFLATETAINDVWAASFGLGPDQIDALPLFPDYNGRVYLGAHGAAGPVARSDMV
jgi:hypothetical protein